VVTLFICDTTVEILFELIFISPLFTMLKVTSKVQCDSLNFAWLAQVAKCNCGNEDYILEYKITITFTMQ